MASKKELPPRKSASQARRSTPARADTSLLLQKRQTERVRKQLKEVRADLVRLLEYARPIAHMNMTFDKVNRLANVTKDLLIKYPEADGQRDLFQKSQR